MVRYTAVSKGFRYFCSFAAISRMGKHCMCYTCGQVPACVNIGRIFFAPLPDKLGAANREIVFKRNLDEEPWHRCGQFLHCILFLCFLSFIISQNIRS